MKRLLITGGSGYLGWHCGDQGKTDWKIYSTYCSNREGVHKSCEPVKLDLTDQNVLWKTLKTIKPDAIFHLAAYSGTSFCEENPDKSEELNVKVVNKLTEMAGDLKAKMIFTSSEQVFDGTQGNYTEVDTPNPQNEYGRQKLEAEKAIQLINQQACIIRIAVLFGRSTPAAKSFLNQWTESWEKMVPVTAFYDEIRPFLSGENCAAGLFHLLEQGAEGIFHFGGEHPLSRLEFAELAKETLDFPNAIIQAKSQKEIETSAFRPSNLSLDCHKLIGTGFKLEAPIQGLKKLTPFFEKKSGELLN